MYLAFEDKLNQLLSTIPSSRADILFTFDNLESPTRCELTIRSKVGQGDTHLPLNVIHTASGVRLSPTDQDIEDSPHARFLIKLANPLFKHPIDAPDNAALKGIETMLARFKKPQRESAPRQAK